MNENENVVAHVSAEIADAFGMRDIPNTVVHDALPTIQQVLEYPGTHNYLKDTIRLFLSKDPVDALNDAELLYLLLRKRVGGF